MKTSPSRLSYGKRAELCQNPIAKKLFETIEAKESNLAVTADVTTSKELLALADRIGPEICVLKTHIDILKDFSLAVIQELKHLAEKHHFLIFEDRKFADIGNTVVEQYRGGIYHIADWADIINAHIVPGPGIIEGLRQVGKPKGQGLLLLAEMSSGGTMAKGDYTHQAVEMAQAYEDFVIGFISLKKLVDDPKFVHMTPGVQLEAGGDALGQQYRTLDSVIANGTDVIIVGRGIYGAKYPKEEALKYRKEGWRAYSQTIKS